MVGFGIVKLFKTEPMREGGQYGFFYEVDDHGELTGRELFFHRSSLTFVCLNPWQGKPEFRDEIKKWPRYRQPTKGAQVVFELGEDGRGRLRATAWNYREVWDAKQQLLQEERELEWRIVLKGYEVTGIIRFAGTVDETGREEFINVALTGKRNGSITTASHWTAKDLEFYDPHDDVERQGYDGYVYYLQVRLPSGKWLQLKSIRPAQDPADICPHCARHFQQCFCPPDCPDCKRPIDVCICPPTPPEVWCRSCQAFHAADRKRCL